VGPCERSIPEMWRACYLSQRELNLSARIACASSGTRYGLPFSQQTSHYGDSDGGRQPEKGPPAPIGLVLFLHSIGSRVSRCFRGVLVRSFLHLRGVVFLLGTAEIRRKSFFDLCPSFNLFPPHTFSIYLTYLPSTRPPPKNLSSLQHSHLRVTGPSTGLALPGIPTRNLDNVNPHSPGLFLPT